MRRDLNEYYILEKGKVKVAQSCPALGDPMDYSSPGSTVHGIFQRKILEWVAIPFSKSLPNAGIEPRYPHFRQILYHLRHQGPISIPCLIFPFCYLSTCKHLVF